MPEGESLRGHPREGLIRELALSGWNPHKIHTWMVANYPEFELSEELIRGYINNYIDPSDIVPPSVLSKVLKGVQVKIDSLQDFYDLIQYQKYRMNYLDEMEKSSRVALPDMRQEIELLSKLLKMVYEMELSVGIRKRAPTEIPASLDSRTYSVDEFIDAYVMKKKRSEKHGHVSPSSEDLTAP